jgi:2-dehydropantoate 2-reductase
MDAMAESGLRITGIWGGHLAREFRCQTSVEGLTRDEFDVILLSVKSYATRDAAEEIRPLVGDATLVCSYQNGLGNAEIIAEKIGWEHTFGARVIFGAVILDKGHVDVTVMADSTVLGVWREVTPVEPIRQIAYAMNEAGAPTVFTDTFPAKLWSKVAYNCSLNPLSALLDVPYGRLLDTDGTKAIMENAVRELYAVGHSLGIALEPVEATAYVQRLFDTLIPATAQHYASMREDFQRKRRTEIDVLNGAICRYGEAQGIPCPANLMLTQLVRAREHAYL